MKYKIIFLILFISPFQGLAQLPFHTAKINDSTFIDGFLYLAISKKHNNIDNPVGYYFVPAEDIYKLKKVNCDNLEKLKRNIDTLFILKEGTEYIDLLDLLVENSLPKVNEDYILPTPSMKNNRYHDKSNYIACIKIKAKCYIINLNMKQLRLLIDTSQYKLTNGMMPVFLISSYKEETKTLLN